MAAWIKGIGLLLMGLGSSGLGVWYGLRFQERLAQLRYMNRILEMLMSEVRFGRCTRPECCWRMAARTREPYRGAFREIYETMRENTGESFSRVYCQVMERHMRELAVRPEEKRLFAGLFAQEASPDGALQVRSLEQYREELGEKIERLERESAEKSRMAMGLGVMCGLLLIVLFL